MPPLTSVPVLYVIIFCFISNLRSFVNFPFTVSYDDTTNEFSSKINARWTYRRYTTCSNIFRLPAKSERNRCPCGPCL